MRRGAAAVSGTAPASGAAAVSGPGTAAARVAAIDCGTNALRLLVGADVLWPTCVECQIEEDDLGDDFGQWRSHPQVAQGIDNATALGQLL